VAICKHWHRDRAVSGIVVVDIDNPDAKEEVKKILPSDYAINSVPRSVTGRGWHLVFAHPGVEIKNRTGILPKVDVRGDGGYFIVWPSMHISGKQYRWQVPPSDNLPKLPVELVLINQLARARAAKSRDCGKLGVPTVDFIEKVT
jgi:Bifunctional DNA primase/polymerase, N-terminal